MNERGGNIAFAQLIHGAPGGQTLVDHLEEVGVLYGGLRLVRAWGAVTAAASREWPARSATESSGAGVEAWMGERALIKIMKIPVFLLQLFRLLISIPFSGSGIRREGKRKSREGKRRRSGTSIG